MSRRANEYKPLLFTTTLRNPERIKGFMKVLSTYNNQRLTNEVIMKVVKDLIKGKLYTTMYERRNSELKAVLKDDNLEFSNRQVNRIIENSPQNHKEAGFDKGWPSRFDTWYKFCKELGFVDYSYNSPIVISEAGLNLSMSDEQDKRHLEQQVFMNAFVKYHRKNPYRRIKNTNKPLILLLNVLNRLKEVYGVDNAGISVKEIPLIIVWKDNDYMRLVDTIIQIRKTYRFMPSDEVIYDYCKRELNLTSDDEKRFKISNITKELPDEFVRKMRLTGLISIRGYGRFVDFNYNEMGKVEYVLRNYQELVDFQNKEEYFNYMRDIDSNLVSLESRVAVTESEKERFLNHWTNQFENDILVREMGILASRNQSSRHDVFRYLSGPIRLEFLTALILKKNYPDIKVIANYNIDDEGLPTSFAQGGDADIVCIDDQGNVLFEVTLLTGTQQNIREMPAIARHLRNYIEPNKISYSVILAPTIHSDTIEYAAFIKVRENLDIYPITIPDFISNISSEVSFRELH